MKKISTYFIIMFLAFLVVACTSATNHEAVFNGLDVQFAEGDSKGSVTKNFTLPLTSTIDESATISWTSSNSQVIKIESETTAVVIQTNRIEIVKLNVAIKIGSQTQTYTYSVTVRPKQILKFAITFDTNGGTTVSKIQVDEGIIPTKPKDPTRDGYEFKGWQLDGVDYLFNQPLTTNIHLVAVWQEIVLIPVSYKVIHHQQNLIDDLYQIVEEDIQNFEALPGTTIEVEPKTYEGFFLKPGQTLEFIVLEDGSLEINLYYDRNIYKLSFDGEEQFVRHGSSATPPVVTPDEGYEFYGWDPQLPQVITESQNYSSIIRATSADYLVNYYQQNIETDLYTLFDTNQLRDVIGKQVIADTPIFEGFILAEEQTLTGIVLADGTLVIDVYYDRNVYTVTFDNDSQQVRFGAAALIPSVEVEPGYEHKGWNPEVPSTITQDRVFTSIIEAIEVSYLVRHYEQNISGDGYQLASSETLKGITDTTIVVSPKVYTGYSLKENQELSYTVKGDGTLVIDVYYDRNVYTVTFDNDSQQVRFGAAALIPSVEVEPGYEHKGWNPEVPSIITQDQTFIRIVRAIEVSYIVEHLGQNILDDNYQLLERDALYGYTDSSITVDTKEFVSHILVPGQILEYTVKGDGTLIIQIKYDRKVLEVFFDIDGDITKQTVRYGQVLTKPVDPIKEGYQFTQWTLNTNVYDFSQIVTTSITLRANFSAGNVSYVVRHYQQNILDDDYTLKDTDSLLGVTGETVIASTRNYEGFTLITEDVSGIVLADGTLVIKVYYDRNVYTVSFVDDIASQEVRYQGYIIVPEDPIKEGYEFVEFAILFNEEIKITDPVTSNLSFYAKFKDITPPELTIKNSVVYVTRLANVDLLEKIEASATDNEDSDITIFLDLQTYTNQVAGTYTILVIAKDHTLNETSKEVTIIVEPIKYIVTFDYGYDNQANIIFAEEDKPIEAFPNLTRENYQFVEWLLNGETFDETTPVSSDMTLVGSWESAQTFTVSFNSNGGSSVETQYITENGFAFMPFDPQRANYQFNVWYLGTEIFDFANTPITRNMTLTASWIKVSEIGKVDLTESISFYQQADSYQIYTTTSNQLIFKHQSEIINLTSYLNLENDETILYMISALPFYKQNDQVEIVILTSLDLVKYIIFNTTLKTVVANNQITTTDMTDIRILYRYDLFFAQSNFIIFDDVKVILWNKQGSVDITDKLNLSQDEYIVVDDVVIDDPYDFVIKTNKRYFIPVSEAKVYLIDADLNSYYVDITNYLLTKLPGNQIIEVRAAIEGISAFDEKLNKVMIDLDNNGDVRIVNKTSSLVLNQDEFILESQAPFFITNQRRVFFINEITSNYEIVEIDLSLEVGETIELLVVNLEMTLIKTSLNKFYSLSSNLAKPKVNDVSLTILGYIESGYIDVAYKSSEVFVIIGNGIVLTIA